MYLNKRFIEIIDVINNNLKIRYASKNETKTENILAGCVKLNEEIGELCSELLAKFYKRRNGDFNKENLELEFADSIITIMLLAKSLDINVNNALIKKIDIIKKRGGT